MIIDISDVHVNQALTGLSVLQANEEYVADRVAPIVAVAKETDVFYRYNLAHTRLIQAERGLRTEAHTTERGYSTSTYTAQQYALARMIDDRERDNADPVLDLDMDETMDLTEMLMLDREFRVGLTMTATANYTGLNSSPSNKWDASAGVPVADIAAAKAAVRASLKRANTFTTSAEVAEELAAHSTVLDLAKYVRDLSRDISLPEKFLGLDVVIGSARYDSAAQGATAVLTAVWPDSAIIHYVNPSMGRRDYNHYATFRAKSLEIRKMREERQHSDVVEACYTEALVQIGTDAGYLYTDVLT